MKNYRLSSWTKEHYTSLADLREAWGMKPIVKKQVMKKNLQNNRKNLYLNTFVEHVVSQ